MPTAHDIRTFSDDTPPPGCSPWVGDYRPRTGIEVVEPDPAWPAHAAALGEAVRSALGWRVLVLEHVGSTSVPDLPAKPVIDLDLTVADPEQEAAYVPALEAIGFTHTVREPWWHGHRAFVHATPACNLHVFGPDSPETWRHRIFRDWLRGNAEDRERYAAVKRAAAEAANDRGEHVMDYNARKQQVLREIYQRAFEAAGLA